MDYENCQIITCLKTVCNTVNFLTVCNDVNFHNVCITGFKCYFNRIFILESVKPVAKPCASVELIVKGKLDKLSSLFNMY